MHGAAQAAHFVGAQSTIAANPLFSPLGIAVDPWGNVYFGDLDNRRVMKETATLNGFVQSTVVDSVTSGFPFLDVNGVAVDCWGSVYVADEANEVVLKETPNNHGGYTQTVIYSGGPVEPTGVAVNGHGDVFIAGQSNGTIVKLTPAKSGYTQSAIGSGLSLYQVAIAADNAGDVYLIDFASDAVIKETPTRYGYAQTVVASGFADPLWVSADNAGNVYVIDYFPTTVWKETPAKGGGYTQSVVPFAGVTGPTGLAIDAFGSVYATDFDNHRVVQLDPLGGNFGLTEVGSHSGPISAIFTFDKATTLGSVGVQTLGGGAGQEFANLGSGTCDAGTTYAAGASCSVDVAFNPRIQGLRIGSVTLSSWQGKPLAAGFVAGTGVR